ncbi:MAG: hypothetical protein IPG93_07335 [Burkholderiales bacterium]|nr:hypothetical protein [Burkholderiales bacterium]
MKHANVLTLCGGVLAALVVVACGGGGGGGPGSPPTGATLSGATPGAMSSGTISAFGSVYVNGHRFRTTNAVLIDDDDDSRSTDLSDLEVGMSVDVKASSRSRHDDPEADEIRLPSWRAAMSTSPTRAPAPSPCWGRRCNSPPRPTTATGAPAWTPPPRRAAP